MPRSLQLKPARWKWAKSSEAEWFVALPSRISENGKRQRFFFSSRQKAQTFCEATAIRIENFGIKGNAILPPSQQEQAANALAALQPYDVTLNEVVQDWIARHKAATASIPFEAAMDGFLKYGKRSESYTRSIRQTRNRLETLHGKLLNEIGVADIKAAMGGMPDSVKNFTLRILGGLFNWGMSDGNTFCVENPAGKITMESCERGEVEVHSPAEVAAILNAAQATAPELVPFLAVSFFTGIRRSEALRLNWSSIDLHEKFVRLPANITKTNTARTIEISDNLRAWLLPFVKESGRVVDISANVLRTRERGLRAAHKVRSIKHGPRHAFASFWLAMHGAEKINQLTLALGHTDFETTRKHYLNLATKRDAAKYWAITPAKSRKILTMKAA